MSLGACGFDSRPQHHINKSIYNLGRPGVFAFGTLLAVRNCGLGNLNNMKQNIVKMVSLAVLLLGSMAVINAQNRSVLAKAERVSGDQFSYSARTRNGARVYSVSRPSPSALNAIDRGLTDLFAVARRNGYRRHLNYSDYTVYIARDDAGGDTPGIAVGAAQYRGSVYDRGGYIYAAGMVIDFPSSSFIVAEPKGNFDSISNIVRYEGEHIVLFYNDRQRFEETKDHSRGGGHPILQ